jgi:hypothetical protein
MAVVAYTKSNLRCMLADTHPVGIRSPLAADLVRRRVAVVVAPSVLAALAAKAATTTAA